MRRFATWDDYTDSNGTLRNKIGATDAVKLRAAEEWAAQLAIADLLERDPVAGDFDRDHMKAIHFRIFGRIYDWAGRERVGPLFPTTMTKAGPTPAQIESGDFHADPTRTYYYLPADGMTEHFDRWAGNLSRYGDMAAMSAAEFAGALAEPWGEINAAHIFREGNTRTQVVFFTYFARRHGHTLDYARFRHDRDFRARFNAARFMILANRGSDLFVATLEELIDQPRPTTATEPAAPAGDSVASDDYQPHQEAYAPRGYAGRCGAITRSGTPCRRRGRCPHHGTTS